MPEVITIPAQRELVAKQDKYHQQRVAAYCRVSTELEEQQNSFQMQVSYYTDYISKNKEWKLAGIYADEGLSGTDVEKRDGFKKMIKDCRNKKIDLILCKSFSRFSRNNLQFIKYVRELKDLGIGIIFEKENINTLTAQSEFMIALYASFAQAESESISQNVSWGIEKGFRDGKPKYNFKYLFGYKRNADGKPEIVQDEAEVVRKIYRMFLDGYSTRDIADIVSEDEAVRTRLTWKSEYGKWKSGRILSILRNEKYVGDIMCQKTFTKDCISHKQIKNNGERNKYLIKDAHDAIIDRDTFNMVQNELARRAAKRKKSDKCITEQGKYSSKYALTELMICGECGSAYKRCTWNVHGKKSIVWRCISRLDHGSKYCKHSPTMHEDKLHSAIIRAVNEYYESAVDIREILNGAVDEVIAGASHHEIRQIEQRLREIDKARNKLVELISGGEMTPDSFDAEFAALFDEEQTLNGRLTSLRQTAIQTEQQQIDLAIAKEEISQAPLKLTDFDDILMRKLIECVKVISKHEIIVIFKGGYEMDASVEE